MKQTAVEWLIEQYENDFPLTFDAMDKAKAMEKEQIIKASSNAYQDMFGSDGTEYGEEYYNETFKSE